MNQNLLISDHHRFEIKLKTITDNKSYEKLKGMYIERRDITPQGRLNIENYMN